MKRYYVSRHYIKWKGRLYRKGELLPPEFNHHDKARNIYSSRIGEVDIEDGPVESSFAGKGAVGATPPQSPMPPRVLSGNAEAAKPLVKGTSIAAKNRATAVKPTGTPK